jgi:hypothetical protein
MTTTTTDLRYPIGPFVPALPVTVASRAAAIADIAALPRHMRGAVAGLAARQLDTPYRPGGWTMRQVVHHVADSHMNAYIRLKLALTEDTPRIKPYDENAWSTLADVALDVEVSLALLDTLHARWVAVLDAMTPDAFTRSFVHPELGEAVSIDRLIQTYSWHSRHHVAHLTGLRRREGW